MMQRGCVAIASAGRDRDAWMVVLYTDDSGVWVADGRRRPITKPKRKNPRHLIPTGQTVNETAMATNRELRRTLAAIKAAADNG